MGRLVKIKERIKVPAPACMVKYYLHPLPCGVYGTSSCGRCMKNPWREENIVPGEYAEPEKV